MTNEPRRKMTLGQRNNPLAVVKFALRVKKKEAVLYPKKKWPRSAVEKFI